jgi:DNA-directed RNA polymerase subunit RPC12/RpoP
VSEYKFICSCCFAELKPDEVQKGRCPHCNARLRGEIRDKFGVVSRV